MKKNKIAALIAAALYAFTFTSCGSSDTSSTAKSEDGNYVAPNENNVYYDDAGNDAAADDGAVRYAPSADTVQETAAMTYGDLYEEGVVGVEIEEESPAMEAAPAADIANGAYINNSMYYYDPNTEEYQHFEENGFKSVAVNPLSTFSADVDTASYTNIRRMLNNGYSNSIYADMVRIEEILNYFDYDYPDAVSGEPFSVTTELSDCPWNEYNKLMLVGIKADESQYRSDMPMNLVFLIDVSGSMFDDDKLPLVQQAFSMLTDNLDGEDRISIVTYAGEDRIVLEGETGDNKEEIKQAIESLSAGGSTAGAAGIKTAYSLAERCMIEGGNNRVILATDGDLNVGASSVEELTALIEEEREKGVFLSVLGFGEGNYKDNRLEALADNGNGNYSYIDCLSEAKKVLIDEMDSTLVTVAKDVKFQVEFNPENVAGYRLIGYENRALADEDFNDDTKDAGEVGAGSTVTVLYELIMKDSGSAPVPETPDLKYAQNTAPETTLAVTEPYVESEYSDELLTVNIRCKAPESDESKLYSYPVTKSQYNAKMPKNLNFAACCAEFGMLLRNSDNKGTSSWGDIKNMLRNYDYSDDEYKTEFEYLVRIAENTEIIDY